MKNTHEFLCKNFLSEFYKSENRGFIPGQAHLCDSYVPLNGDLGRDWGVILNPKSERFGMITFEHDWCGCKDHYKQEPGVDFIYYVQHEKWGKCITSFCNDEEVLHYQIQAGEELDAELAIIVGYNTQIYDCIYKEYINEPFTLKERKEIMKNCKTLNFQVVEKRI